MSPRARSISSPREASRRRRRAPGRPSCRWWAILATDAVIGWDVGGAHLKVARLDATGAVERVLQLPCPLWQGMDHLHRALDQACASLTPAPVHVMTMTGEM